MNTSFSAHPEAAARPGPLAALLARWPSLVGLVLLVAAAAGGVEAHLTAMIIMIAALCYLAAAAFGHRITAWIALPIISALVFVAMITPLDAIVLILVLAAAVSVFGLIRLPRTGRRELGFQAAGFVVFTGVGLVAMMQGPVLAAHLAGLVAIGHGVWSVIHHRRNQVVSRSFAEFCAVLSIGLGAVTLIITWFTLAA